MGLFDFLKPKKTELPRQEERAKGNFKTALDQVEKYVFAELKPLGFKKKGRTFNREVEKGVFQVINFQAGPYPIGENYEVPGLRENLYGKFTVNLGVCVDSLYKLLNPAENKLFYKEYQCQMRIRLDILMKGKDCWWALDSNNADEVTEEIIRGISTVARKWFDGVNSREKIIENLGVPPYRFTPRAKLDAALIVWLENKLKGTELFNNYLMTISNKTGGHEAYVKKLAKDLGIEIK